MRDDELIETFRKRAQSWAWNDDTAWVKVKLGEMRAILRILDTNPTARKGKSSDER